MESRGFTSITILSRTKENVHTEKWTQENINNISSVLAPFFIMKFDKVKWGFKTQNQVIRE